MNASDNARANLARQFVANALAHSGIDSPALMEIAEQQLETDHEWRAAIANFAAMLALESPVGGMQ